MKNLFLILVLVSTTIFAQEKKRVFAPSYNVEYANLVIKTEKGLDTLKVVQEIIVKDKIKMSGKQYNRFIDPNIDNGNYYLKKVFKVRPVNIDRFFNEVYLCEYFYNEEGKNIIITQRVNNSVTLNN